MTCEDGGRRDSLGRNGASPGGPSQPATGSAQMPRHRVDDRATPRAPPTATVSRTARWEPIIGSATRR